MRKIRIKNWSLQDLAMLIGLRALGMDYDFIADRLECSRGEARGMLQAARGHLQSGQWVDDLLADPDHRAIDESDRVDRHAGGQRQFRVKRVSAVSHVPVRDVTAELMGDPASPHTPKRERV